MSNKDKLRKEFEDHQKWLEQQYEEADKHRQPTKEEMEDRK